jgi:hypothetical protein
VVFDYFSSVLDAIIVSAKSRGVYDAGIRSLVAARGVTVDEDRVLHEDKTTRECRDATRGNVCGLRACSARSSGSWGFHACPLPLRSHLDHISTVCKPCLRPQLSAARQTHSTTHPKPTSPSHPTSCRPAHTPGATTRLLQLSLDFSLKYEDAVQLVEDIKKAPPGGALRKGNGFWVDMSTNNWAGSTHPRILVATQVRVCIDCAGARARS